MKILCLHAIPNSLIEPYFSESWSSCKGYAVTSSAEINESLVFNFYIQQNVWLYHYSVNICFSVTIKSILYNELVPRTFQSNTSLSR